MLFPLVTLCVHLCNFIRVSRAYWVFAHDAFSCFRNQPNFDIYIECTWPYVQCRIVALCLEALEPMPIPPIPQTLEHLQRLPEPGRRRFFKLTKFVIHGGEHR